MHVNVPIPRQLLLTNILNYPIMTALPFGKDHHEEKIMSLFSLFILAVGLSMDACSVAICKGLATPKITFKKAAVVGLWFGGFQALMPAIGYLAGYRFQDLITAWDHWIAFVLLALIGGNMIKEAFSKEEGKEDYDCDCDSLSPKKMFPMAIATSIDALAVGVTFAFLPDVPIIPAVSFIGIVTFVLSAIGMKIGNVFGVKFKTKAQLAGGVILVGLGFKILIEHLFF